MNLGDILVKKKIVTKQDVERALDRQQQMGGRIGDNLVQIGAMTSEQLASILNAPPAAPKSAEDCGISDGDLRALIFKVMSTLEAQTVSRIADVVKLPNPVIQEVLNDAVNLKLVEVLGSTGDGSGLSELRHGLTRMGKERAAEALDQSLYVGPAPVSLEAYTYQIKAQKITNEEVSRDQVSGAFDNLVIADSFMDDIGPAINSGKSILLYGPPGNGKTTIAERIAHIFCNIIYIPYCIEIDGQVIKVFDPSIHVEIQREERSGSVSIRRDHVDRRWVPCERPIVITGGELTLEMLDLKFNPQARFYEAPLHIKALGGTFIIDDFGRQIVSPEEILNRWIVPLQSRIDFLKLHTGKSFELPFDELIIFSTNMEPNDLMVPAFLRRIPYKLETIGPNTEEFRVIMNAVAGKAGIEVDDQSFDMICERLLAEQNGDLACYQPTFIVDQILCSCKYEGIAPQMREDLIERAINNLFAKPRSRWDRAGVKGQQEKVAQAIAS